jgi:hypothetical protein
MRRADPPEFSADDISAAEQQAPAPAYPPARAVAVKLEQQFAALAGAQHDCMAFAPSAAIIEQIINAAFWASLRREEGYVPTISLAFLPPEQSEHPLRLETPVPLLPYALTRLSPAVERPGIHLGVWQDASGLTVWGATRSIPMFCFVLEVLAPGLLVVKHRRAEESGKFVNVAVLEGDKGKVLIQDAASVIGSPALVTSLLGFDSPSSLDSVNVLVQLAVSMRAHGRGGSLLVVPAGSDSWRDSIVQPIRYGVSPSFLELTELARSDPAERPLRRAVDAMAGLTAVDGATVITNEYELHGFGAKIARRRGSPPVDRVIVTEPVEDAVATVMNPSQMGGMRHLSAAQFVHDQRNAVALVASQDGRFTVFAWSEADEIVHAHRVESLLL